MNLLGAKVVETAPGTVVVELTNFPGARLRKTLMGALPKAGDAVTLGVRPEKFGAAGAGGCDITVSVDVAEHLGPTSYVYANTTTAEQLVIERAESRGETGSRQLTVSIAPDRAFLFDSAGKRLP